MAGKAGEAASVILSSRRRGKGAARVIFIAAVETRRAHGFNSTRPHNFAEI